MSWDKTLKSAFIDPHLINWYFLPTFTQVKKQLKTAIRSVRSGVYVVGVVAPVIIIFNIPKIKGRRS
jgi:hypothetical protein